MKRFLSMVLSLLLSFSSCSSWNSDEDIPAQTDTPRVAMTEQTPEPLPTPTPDYPEIDAQPPSTTAKASLEVLDSINGNSVLTVGDGVYYEFDDHGYMSVGLDGTLLPYDVYYGIGVTVVDNEFLDVTWHNYSDMDVHPTTITVKSPYHNESNNLGDIDRKEGEVYTIAANSAATGPYAIEVAWDNGVITSVYVYINGDDMYTCQSSDHSATYLCYWYDRKDAIDALLAEQGFTPENSLDYSDDYWAYPVPADYGKDYRCDNQRWIDLADELTDDDMSDAQKAIVIHDWMTANLVYDKYKADYLGDDTRATIHDDFSGKYSMWDTKVGVCADFSTVYCIMLRSLGIPAVSLDFNDEHVWNVVYLDGDWVEIDTTDDINRIVYTEDITNISSTGDIVDYVAFGTPYTIDDITDKHNINWGVYTYSYVTGKNK